MQAGGPVMTPTTPATSTMWRSSIWPLQEGRGYHAPWLGGTDGGLGATLRRRGEPGFDGCRGARQRADLETGNLFDVEHQERVQDALGGVADDEGVEQMVRPGRLQGPGPLPQIAVSARRNEVLGLVLSDLRPWDDVVHMKLHVWGLPSAVATSELVPFEDEEAHASRNAGPSA